MVNNDYQQQDTVPPPFHRRRRRRFRWCNSSRIHEFDVSSFVDWHHRFCIGCRDFDDASVTLDSTMCQSLQIRRFVVWVIVMPNLSSVSPCRNLSFFKAYLMLIFNLQCPGALELASACASDWNSAIIWCIAFSCPYFPTDLHCKSQEGCHWIRCLWKDGHKSEEGYCAYENRNRTSTSSVQAWTTECFAAVSAKCPSNASASAGSRQP